MALETLGAVGVVCQLAGHCIYALELVDKIRRSTETLKEYQAQVQGLRVLSEAIEQNPLLQTREILSHTQTILKTIQQHDSLTLLLRKRRLYRIWTFPRVERRLSEHTKNIEILKSTLSISIQDQQCRILDSIDKRTQTSAMPQLVGTRGEQDVFSGRTANVFEDNPADGDMQMVRVPFGSGSLVGMRPEVPPSEVPPGEIPADEIPADEVPADEEDPLQTELVERCLEPSSDASAWINNTVGAGVNQHNGSTIKGVTEQACIDLKESVWVGNDKHGWGHQRNGVIVSGNNRGWVPTPQIKGVKWVNNKFPDAQNDNDYYTGTPALGRQENGHLYEAEWGPTRER